MGQVISFDIETVPQEELSRSQKEHLDKLVEARKRNDRDVDIERLKSTDPFLGKIICIGHARMVPGNEIITESITGEEDFILRQWWHALKEYGSNTTYVSFNGLDFDVHFIKIRGLANGIKPSKRKFLSTKKYQKFPHYDLLEWITGWDYRKRINLDLVCDLLDVPTPKTGAVKAENVHQAYKDGQIKEIAKYCEKDCKATLKIYLKMQDLNH